MGPASWLQTPPELAMYGEVGQGRKAPEPTTVLIVVNSKDPLELG